MSIRRLNNPVRITSATVAASGGYYVQPPTLAPNLIGWWDAYDYNTITFVSGNVSQWNDKSGNGKHAAQTTAANRPTYSATALNSRPAIVFGSNQLLIASTPFSATADYTVFAVGQLTSNSGSYQRLLNGSPDYTLFFGTNNGNYTTFVGTGSSWYDTTANVTNTTVLNTPRVLTLLKSGTSATPYISGTAQTAKTATSTGGFNGLLFGNIASLIQQWNGHICEIVVYQRALTSTERTAIEKYLGNKWGITI